MQNVFDAVSDTSMALEAEQRNIDGMPVPSVVSMCITSSSAVLFWK